MDSIGKYLKERRESLNISVEEAAKNTRLKEYILLQLENDDYKAINDVGFTKIMAVTYCRFLEGDITAVQSKLKELFDTPTELPVKKVPKKTKIKKTRFIPTNLIYFFLLGVLISFLGYAVFRIYQNESISFNYIRDVLKSTERNERPATQMVDVPQDSLWLHHRQIFHEMNNISPQTEFVTPVENRNRLTLRRENATTNDTPFSRHFIHDQTDYVGEFIFNNQPSPLNQEI